MEYNRCSMSTSRTRVWSILFFFRQVLNRNPDFWTPVMLYKFLLQTTVFILIDQITMCIVNRSLLVIFITQLSSYPWEKCCTVCNMLSIKCWQTGTSILFPNGLSVGKICLETPPMMLFWQWIGGFCRDSDWVQPSADIHTCFTKLA